MFRFFFRTKQSELWKWNYDEVQICIEIKGKLSDLYLFLSQLSWLAASLELRVAYPQFCWIQDSQIEIIEVVGLIGCLFSCT